MNIFIISRGYPTKQEPTWGCFEKDQAEALAQLGHQVTILSVDTRFRFYWRKLGIQCGMQNNIATFNIFLLPYALLFFLPKKMKDWFYAWQLELIYKCATSQQGTPDVLYSHYLHTTQKAIRIHKKYNIPLVGIEHWSQMALLPISRNNLSTAWEVYSSIDQLITVSSSLRKNILEQMGLDSIVLPNIVGNEFYYTNPTCKNQVFTMVSVGRLDHGKGFDLLIQALFEIKDQLPKNWQTKIIGSGELKDTLQHKINTYNLQDNIILLGKKSKEDIVPLLQQSDLFILPSRSETFGVAYIEAMACGLPIIATDCGGPRDIVTEYNGLLIPNEDVDALSAAILYMAKNINKYDRKAIAEDCQARFSPEVIARQLTKIFKETIKKHKEQE